jgi:hypothetical protein
VTEQQENKLRGLMGLCLRARQAVFGEDGCMKTIRGGNCGVLLLDSGASKTVKIVFTPLNQNVSYENKAAAQIGSTTLETNTVKNRTETEIKTYPTGIAGRNPVLPAAAILGSVVLAVVWIKKRKK